MVSNTINLFETKNYESLVQRIQQLKATDKPLWGKMNVAQMLAHCAEIQEVANGKSLKTPFLLRLFKGFIRKAVVNEVAYKKGTPTHPQYLMHHTEVDFEKAKERFLKALEIMHQQKGEAIHPLFGEMTEKERSWGMYKHHNHHLQQFGV